MRFPWEKAQVQGSCLIWPKATDKDGYAYFKRKGMRPKRAHRAAYESVFGPQPPGTVIMHSCDVRACVALQHLSPGSPALNMADMAAKGRRGKPNSKLVAEDIVQIRARFAAGETTKVIAEAFGVTPENVNYIVRRVTWRDVP